MSSPPPITLLRVTAGNPFAAHPQLRQIWHASLQPHVEADTVADLARCDNDPARNLVYLVMQRGIVVGITGVYDLGEHDLGLRWHGIVPAARHGGLSGQAFQAVLGQARQERPERRRIVEYIEMRDSNAARLIAHFEKLGFRRDGPARDAARFPAECALPEQSGDWQAMVVDLTT